ncbi:hypothetical protein R80B4_00586 [Fibrobacteres bacterium R8-0-B4]
MRKNTVSKGSVTNNDIAGTVTITPTPKTVGTLTAALATSNSTLAYGTPGALEYVITYAPSSLEASADNALVYVNLSGLTADAHAGLGLNSTAAGANTTDKQVQVPILKTGGTVSVWIRSSATSAARNNADILLYISGSSVPASNGVVTGTPKLTITQKPATIADFDITWPTGYTTASGSTNKNYVYDATAKNISVSWKSNTGSATPTIKYYEMSAPTNEVNRANVKDVGTYKITIETVEQGNYAAFTTATLADNIVIAKATPTVVWPTFNEMVYNPGKQTVGDYLPDGKTTTNSTTDGAHIAENGSVTGAIGADLTANGKFTWTEGKERIAAVKTGNGNAYGMVWTPTETATAKNYKIAYAIAGSLPGTAGTADNAKVGGAVTFKIVKKPLEVANVMTATTFTDAASPTTDDWSGYGKKTVYNGKALGIKFGWHTDVTNPTEDADRGPTKQGAIKGKLTTVKDSIALQVGYVGNRYVSTTAYGSETSPNQTEPVDAGVYQIYVRVANEEGNYLQSWITDPTWQLIITPRPVAVNSVTHTKVYDAARIVSDPAKITVKLNNGGAVGTTDATNGKLIGTPSIGVSVTEAYYAQDTAKTIVLQIFDAALTGTGKENYKLTFGDQYVADAANDETGYASGKYCIIKESKAAKTTDPNGITPKPIKIATSGHDLGEKIYDGDSLYLPTPPDASSGIQGTTIVFDGLEGEDELVYGTDYVLTNPGFKGKNVGEDKDIVAGRLTLQRTITSGQTVTKTTAWNYKFDKAADSLLSGKGIKGTIVKKSLGAAENKALNTPVAKVYYALASTFPAAGKPYTGKPIVLKDTSVANAKGAELIVYDIPGRLANKSAAGKSIITKADYELVYENNETVTSEGATVTIKATEDGNYRDPDEETTGLTVSFMIAPKTLTIAKSGHKVDDRFYVKDDKSAPIASLAFDGLVNGEKLVLDVDADGSGDYTISDAVYSSDAASDAAKTVVGGTVSLVDGSEVAANYVVASTLNITAASKVTGFVRKMPLVITDVTTDGGRVYNGRDTVGVTGVAFATVENPDEPIDIGTRNASTGFTVVGAKYESASVGEGKKIAEGTIALKGSANTTNYIISDASIAGYGDDAITSRTLRINSAKISKPFDGTPTIADEDVVLTFASASGDAGLVATDKDSSGYTIVGGAFADETIKTSGKAITSGTVTLIDYLAENYTLENPELTAFTGTISKGIIPLLVSHTKVYDGTVTATGVEFSVDPSSHPLWAGDAKDQLSPISSWAYTVKSAGTRSIKPSSVTFKATAPKELTDYYTVTANPVEMTEGGITKRPLPIVSVTHTKPFDGTTTAKLTNIAFAPASAGGILAADVATTLLDSAVADYTSPAVGTKTLELKSVALKGTNGGNYAVVIPDTAITVLGTPAGITEAVVSIAKVTVSKVYDGTNTVDPAAVQIAFNGIAAVDTPFVDYTVANVTLVDKNAGTKLISGGKVELINAAFDNYKFANLGDNLQGKGFTVTVAPKTVKILSAEHTKPYDGNATVKSKEVKVEIDPTGLADGDTVPPIDSVQAQYTSSQLGTKTLKINKVFFKGGNYTTDSVTVTLADGGITGTYVDSIKVTAANNVDSLIGRRTLQFTATLFPATASVKLVQWSVSDTALASISANGLLTSKKNGTVVVTAAATDGSGKKGTLTLKISGVGVLEVEREIPTQVVISEAAVAPVKAVVAKFTAGPSPVKVGSSIKFFSGSAVKSGSLYIFDASGNAVAKVAAKAGSGEIGGWDLKGKNGAVVSEGTYIVKGALTGKDGTREKVSFVFSVVK